MVPRLAFSKVGAALVRARAVERKLFVLMDKKRIHPNHLFRICSLEKKWGVGVGVRAIFAVSQPFLSLLL